MKIFLVKVKILPAVSRLPVEPFPTLLHVKSQVLADSLCRKRVSGSAHQLIDLMFGEIEHLADALYVGDLPGHLFPRIIWKKISDRFLQPPRDHSHLLWSRLCSAMYQPGQPKLVLQPHAPRPIGKGPVGCNDFGF